MASATSNRSSVKIYTGTPTQRKRGKGPSVTNYYQSDVTTLDDTEDDAADHGEGEVLDHRAPEHEEHGDGEEGGHGGGHRPRQRLRDGDVQQRRQVVASVPIPVLSDAIVDDDGVVQRVADDGEEGPDHR